MDQAESTARLLERVRAGDRAALDLLFARYAAPLRRWASGRLPGWARGVTDTQDLVQDVLLQTFKRIETFEPRGGEGALQAYLRAAVGNRLRDELRRVARRPKPTALDSQIEDPAPSPLEKAVGREGLEQYERALAALPVRDQEAVVARLEFGYSFAEIAQMLDSPSPEAARKMVERAIVRLVQELNRGA